MSCFSGISSLNKCETLAGINTVTALLSKDLSNDDLNMLGNILVSIGSILMTFGSINDKQDNQKTDEKN